MSLRNKIQSQLGARRSHEGAAIVVLPQCDSLSLSLPLVEGSEITSTIKCNDGRLDDTTLLMQPWQPEEQDPAS